MEISQNQLFLHPLLQNKLKTIIDNINKEMPKGFKCKLISGYRSLEEQFEIFKKGRVYENREWVKVQGQSVYTEKDGFINKSRHNYLPATAFDLGIFNGKKYLEDSKYYNKISACKELGFEWGGDWKSLVDKPHIQIATNQFDDENIDKSIAKTWQKYLKKDGTYNDEIDGIFASKSKAALLQSTNQSERNLISWQILVDRLGIIL